ncbi:MAG: UbiA family prenyltransferase [Deltaproteobacteria bacterium]|nr:UbiA family prenyltransferase [Candidatus Anaeroferrophillus wilburensis]MBN2889483.1 UbiA family prenyltransferase [Deltaproteobacteria bacterium]
MKKHQLKRYSQHLRQRLQVFLELVKFSHTIFALPFALMGALLAAGGLPAGGQLCWIIIAMVGARTGAMGTNRLLDYRIDALNPRTKNRPLPAGQVGLCQVLLLIIGSYGIFVLAASQLNHLCFMLSPYVIIILSAYSLAKRYTVYTHYILGFSLGISPIGAWIAVTGSLALPPIFLGLAVLCWVTGFDLLYALQDITFDQKTGLFSLPAKIGVDATLLLAKRLHLIMLALLLLVFLASPHVGWLYLVGLLLVAGLLHHEHQLLSPTDLSRIDAAFFTVNGYISISLFVVTAIDVLFLH